MTADHLVTTDAALRSRASAIVAEVAERLADPAAFHEEPVTHVLALSLAEGYPSLALLFAELGHADSGHRRTAHAHLTSATASAATTIASGPDASLFYGSGALAFAASRAARRPGEYAGLLTPLDERIAAGVTRVLAPEWERMAAGRAGTAFSGYDVISGAAGIGRYLLDRCAHGPSGPARTALTEVLTYLTALSRPIGDLPGWWVDHAPDGGPGEHANAGLAHGVPGPLALLAVAWTAGVRVPGQDEAIDRYATWLLDRSGRDADGQYWPDTLSRDTLHSRPAELVRTRAAWCYGTLGVARALQLAGAAAGRPAWATAAVTAAEDAAEAVIADAHDGHHGHHGRPTEPGLCHGWGGLLHLTRRVAADAGDPPRLRLAADGLARRVIALYDPQTRFGFRARDPDTWELIDMSGFLEGAAGTALALHAYATGEPPASGWDAALLAG
jgi:lantibiotic biosynthesis protein